MELSEAWDKVLGKLDMVEDEEAINTIRNSSSSEVDRITAERDDYKSKYETLSENYKKRFKDSFTPMSGGGGTVRHEETFGSEMTLNDIDIMSGMNE